MKLSNLKNNSKKRLSYEFYEFFKSYDVFKNSTHKEIKVSLRDADFQALEQTDINSLLKAGFTSHVHFVIKKYNLDLQPKIVEKAENK
jgi:hypothetical protein